MTSSEPVENLINKIPELDYVIANEDRDLPYIAYGAWAVHIMSCLDKKECKSFIEKSIQYMNAMASSSDDQTINLLQVGVLEVLQDFPNGENLIKIRGNADLVSCFKSLK